MLWYHRQIAVPLVPLIVLVIVCGVVLFDYWHQDTTVAPKIEKEQEQTDRMTSTAPEIGEPHKDSEETTLVETPEQVEREISEIIEHLQVLHEPEPAEEDEENSPAPEEPADPIAAAWAHLEYISQNPQQWGNLSPRATELMAQLTPTWDTRAESDMQEAIVLFEELGELQDPRSAEVFVNYLREGGLWGSPMKEALIAIGPPSVPLLIPLLDANARLKGRLIAPKLLGIIGSEYRQELGNVVEYILLPKLEQLATSDPHPRVRQYAGEAVDRLR